MRVDDSSPLTELDDSSIKSAVEAWREENKDEEDEGGHLEHD